MIQTMKPLGKAILTVLIAAYGVGSACGRNLTTNFITLGFGPSSLVGGPFPGASFKEEVVVIHHNANSGSVHTNLGFLYDAPVVVTNNLPVVVTSQVVTNVVEGNNQKGCGTCEGIRKNNWLLYHPPHEYEEWQDATERWAIKSVVRRVTVEVQWQGKPLVHTEETVLFSVTNRWKLTHEWKQE